MTLLYCAGFIFQQLSAPQRSRTAKVGHTRGKETITYPMKRPYEVAVVIRILSNDEETQQAIDQIVAWIEQPDNAGEPQGKVTKIDRTTLGRRKLAYEIDGQRDGYYVLFYADIEPTHVQELELNLKLATTVLRHLIVRNEELEKTERKAKNSPAPATE